MPDSNPQPTVYKTVALPLSYVGASFQRLPAAMLSIGDPPRSVKRPFRDCRCSTIMSVMEHVTVNKQEQQRWLVIAAVDWGALSVGGGAAVLGVSAR